MVLRSTDNTNYERVYFLFKPSLLFLFCKQLQRTIRERDNSKHYLVQCLKSIKPATEQSDWLIIYGYWPTGYLSRVINCYI